MKYVSLMGVMSLYGGYVKDYRSFRSIGYEASSRPFSADVQYDVFEIETSAPDETGQTMKTLKFREGVNRLNIFGPYVPETIILPPVMEIEWMRQSAELTEEQIDVMEYLSYVFIIQIISWGIGRNLDAEPETYYENMEHGPGIMEAEDIADTPIILSACEIQRSTTPKIKSWNLFYVQADYFIKLIELCRGQSQSFKEFYLHLPVLFAMFLIEHDADELSGWTKTDRLNTENKLQDIMQDFTRCMVAAGDLYTYGSSTSITQKDVDLLMDVFNKIYEKIHTKNTTIGLIRYHDYCNVQGPDVIKASVRLCGMSLDWSEMMKKAKQEQEKEEED